MKNVPKFRTNMGVSTFLLPMIRTVLGDVWLQKGKNLPAQTVYEATSTPAMCILFKETID